MIEIRIGQAAEDLPTNTRGMIIGKYEDIDGKILWHYQPTMASAGKIQDAFYASANRLRAVSTHASIGLPTGKKSKGKRLPVSR